MDTSYALVIRKRPVTKRGGILIPPETRAWPCSRRGCSPVTVDAPSATVTREKRCLHSIIVTHYTKKTKRIRNLVSMFFTFHNNYAEYCSEFYIVYGGGKASGEAALKISSERRDCRKRAKRDGTVPGFRTASFSSFTGDVERNPERKIYGAGCLHVYLTC